MKDASAPRVMLSSDHRGAGLRSQLAEWCCEQGLPVEDVGPAPDGPAVDYPDEALAVARSVAAGEAELGILFCGSGIGVSIAANKVPGVRAALVGEPHGAALARRHNDANVLCFGAGTTGVDLAISCLRAFFAAAFEGGRHTRRLDKITQLEHDGGGGELAAAGKPAESPEQAEPR